MASHAESLGTLYSMTAPNGSSSRARPAHPVTGAREAHQREHEDQAQGVVVELMVTRRRRPVRLVCGECAAPAALGAGVSRAVVRGDLRRRLPAGLDRVE